jgi:dTDP-4-dehydrorhamnose 3,5-epimerase
MQFNKTHIQGLLVGETKIFKDSRGYFMESFRIEDLEAVLGRSVNFVQTNISKSSYGVIRGLHFQKGDWAQAKLVRVLSGKVLDVVVDLRLGSPTFKKVFSIELSEDNAKSLFVPKGFAHGFAVLSEQAQVSYRVDHYYSPKDEGGIRFDDKDLDIDWHVPEEDQILSEKDMNLPSLKSYLGE